MLSSATGIWTRTRSRSSCFDALAHGRLGSADALRRASEGAFVDHGEEVFELQEIHWSPFLRYASRTTKLTKTTKPFLCALCVLCGSTRHALVVVLRAEPLQKLDRLRIRLR